MPTRDENAVLLDASGGSLHGRILPHLKGMIRERMQLRQRNLNDYFQLRSRLLGWRGLFTQLFLRCFSGIAFRLSVSFLGQ